MASSLCYSKWYHWTSSFMFHMQLFKTDKSIHNDSRTIMTSNKNEFDFVEEHLADIQYYLKSHYRPKISVYSKPIKSEVIWAETFWSSLSKAFLSRGFFPWQKLWIQTRSSGLFNTWNLRPSQDYTLLHTYPTRLLTQSGCTLPLSIGTELNW